MTIKLAVLISGSGTNLQAIIDAVEEGSLDASIELVLSSRPEAYGLKRAAEAGIPVMALSKEVYADPQVADEVIASELKARDVDYVVLAGYMRKIGPAVLTCFPNSVINLHPALLPSFPGAHAIEEAYDYGVKVTGVTVHVANAEYDRGPIIAQRPVAVEEGWSVDDLEAAIHAVEHELYPEVLRWLAADRVKMDAVGRVHVVTGE